MDQPDTQPALPLDTTPPPSEQPKRNRKRKSTTNNSSNSNSNQSSSKRLAREKASILLPQFNGPCTRAAAASASTAAPVAASVDSAAVLAAELKLDVEEEVGELKYWERKEEEIEKEYEERIRSRDANVHVVPNHCGWFSWNETHALEEQTLASFFNDKCEGRTPSVYMEIRNWIMRKYHADPNTKIEMKDLEEMTVGDVESRQEVMEFLDYWGLINFQPFPPKVNDSGEAMDEADKSDSSTEKLYCFEKVQWCPQVVQRTYTVTPAMPSRLLPEPAIAEELVKPEGPGVEYHCNSCSADCSRKRYHCQKQADFDLCTECYNDGKFGSEMSSSDFILMEPTDALAVSSEWTDQETLLLLEALELFSENWNEIAEHVATKTKAQCILHFVQMPIEDSFLDCEDESEENLLDNVDPASTINDTSALKEALESTENKSSGNEDQAPSSPLEKLAVEKVDDEVKLCTDSGEDFAVKALREAFEAVGSLSMPGEPLRFSEAGNPAMALAAFLARLVEPDAATASARSSLKSISGKSPSMQLAARHCFVLEDPPVEKKETDRSDRNGAEIIDQETQKDEKVLESKQEEEKSSSGLDEEVPFNDRNIKESIQEEDNKMLKTSNDEQTENDAAKESGLKDNDESVGLGNSNHSSNSESPKEQPANSVLSEVLPENTTLPMDAAPSTESPGEHPPIPNVKSDDKMLDEASSSSVKEAGDKALVDQPTQPVEATKDVDMVLESVPMEKEECQQPETSNSLAENGSNEGAEEIDGDNGEGKSSREGKDDHPIDKLKRAAITTLSAAAVKAKLLANQEEDLIRQLASSLIEKQLHKLETKMALFHDIEGVTIRVKEQMDRSRQRLYQERAQIIAARLGIPASQSRAMPSNLPANRIATNFANSASRPPMVMASQRPPFARPTMAFGPASSNPFGSATGAGASIRAPNQDKVSSVRTK